LLWFGCRLSWDQNTAPKEPESNKENFEQHDVEWQDLDLLVDEASSTQGETIELLIEELGNQEHSDSVILLENEQRPTVEEDKLVPKIVYLTMSDNKQQQPQPQPQPQPQQPQPQQQPTAVLDQNVQQVQVQVSAPCLIRIRCVVITTTTTTTTTTTITSTWQRSWLRHGGTNRKVVGSKPRCHWSFSLTYSFQLHYGPEVNSTSNRNE
jgi:hypothetical protein